LQCFIHGIAPSLKHPPSKSSSYSRKLAGAFVQAAIGFDKIGQALTRRLCTSGIPQDAGPLASGFGVSDIRIGSAEDHNCERLRLHPRRIGAKAKGSPRLVQRTIKTPPAHDDVENGRQVNVSRIPVVDRPIRSPCSVRYGQLGLEAGFGEKGTPWQSVCCRVAVNRMG
jgi:hypothetical protein